VFKITVCNVGSGCAGRLSEDQSV